MTVTPTPTDGHRIPVANALRPGGAIHHPFWRAVPVESASRQLDPLPAQAATRRGSYRPMTTADEVSFAWALAAVARELFAARERAWICITLGAGDSTRVVEYLLSAVAKHELTLPDDLVDSAFDWSIGFLGTEKEPRLRALVESLHPPSPAQPRVGIDWSRRVNGPRTGQPAT
jgi:hypothetical protein